MFKDQKFFAYFSVHTVYQNTYSVTYITDVKQQKPQIYSLI